jgi:hypothetical protein
MEEARSVDCTRPGYVSIVLFRDAALCPPGHCPARVTRDNYNEETHIGRLLV